MVRRNLPDFLETLERHDLAPRLVFQALREYQDLATELVLEQEPQLDPHAFLQLSDQRDVVVAFADLFLQQAPHLLFEQSDDEDDDFSDDDF